MPPRVWEWLGIAWNIVEYHLKAQHHWYHQGSGNGNTVLFEHVHFCLNNKCVLLFVTALSGAPMVTSLSRARPMRSVVHCTFSFPIYGVRPSIPHQDLRVLRTGGPKFQPRAATRQSTGRPANAQQFTRGMSRQCRYIRPAPCWLFECSLTIITVLFVAAAGSGLG